MTFFEKPFLMLGHKDAELGFVLKDDMTDEQIMECVKALRLLVAQALGSRNCEHKSFRDIKQEIKDAG
jgi:hypothetical protein